MNIDALIAGIRFVEVDGRPPILQVFRATPEVDASGAVTGLRTFGSWEMVETAHFDATGKTCHAEKDVAASPPEPSYAELRDVTAQRDALIAATKLALACMRVYQPLASQRNEAANALREAIALCEKGTPDAR